MTRLRDPEDKADYVEELGDLLFSVCNLARHLHVDSESAIEGTTALRKTLDDALKTFDLSKITTEDTNWVVSNPVMGLYYALERTDSLTEEFKVHEWDIGNSVSVTFIVNETGKTSGFFRLVISACPPAD